MKGRSVAESCPPTTTSPVKSTSPPVKSSRPFAHQSAFPTQTGLREVAPPRFSHGSRGGDGGGDDGGGRRGGGAGQDPHPEEVLRVQEQGGAGGLQRPVYSARAPSTRHPCTGASTPLFLFVMDQYNFPDLKLMCSLLFSFKFI